MPPSNKQKKKKRRAQKRKRQEKRELQQEQQATYGPCDLHVVFPSSKAAASSDVPVPLLVEQLLNRLALVGYRTVALTHTAYGRPPNNCPNELLLPSKQQQGTSSPTSKLQVLKRLHLVVENTSDLSALHDETRKQQLLQDYDLISVSPRNQAVWEQICSGLIPPSSTSTSSTHMPTIIDIVTLDYTMRGGLPFNIRVSQLQALGQQGVSAIELVYAPAVLHAKNYCRKTWVQASRQLQVAQQQQGGDNDVVILTSGSGSREFQQRDGEDVGVMALRAPDDISNLYRAVLHWDVTSAAAHRVLHRARQRRVNVAEAGYSRVTGISVRSGTKAPPPPPKLYNASSPSLSEQAVGVTKGGKNEDADSGKNDRNGDDAREESDNDNKKNDGSGGEESSGEAADDGFIAF